MDSEVHLYGSLADATRRDAARLISRSPGVPARVAQY
jgi:hypothetical protein